jgi:hypothetical protein
VYLAGPQFAEEYRRRARELARAAAHPWTVYVADAVRASLEEAIGAL